MPEKDADRQCGEHARPDQGCVALKIEIGARAHGERKRRQHDDCGERERIAAAAPLFKAERASRTHIEGESPERKENAKRRTERNRSSDGVVGLGACIKLRMASIWAASLSCLLTRRSRTSLVLSSAIVLVKRERARNQPIAAPNISAAKLPLMASRSIYRSIE